MKLIMKKQNRLCVQLSSKDLEDMGFTFESINENKDSSKSFVKSACSKITGELGADFSALSDNTLIEAMPATKGGCILFFTFNECNTVICSFKSLDCIYSLAYNIYNEKKITASGLYVKDGEYKMLLVFNSALDEKTVNLLCEFADISFSFKEKEDLSRGKTIAYPDAIGKLVNCNK